MGLASALSTALTGLTAAETTIDVVGNNLANSNTVGFKASRATFATQFLQTQSLGSAPTANSGGTNPRQVGLGTMVADVTPDFNQGTIEISANPTDLAIQGEGFYIVQGPGNDRFYTRNGVFKLNSQNQLTTITGHRLLGYGVDDNFQLRTTQLVPLTIPLGRAAVAQPTNNVFLEGTLSPTGDLADTASVIQTGVLSDGQYSFPLGAANIGTAPAPPIADVNVAIDETAGDLGPGTYRYRLIYADGPPHESLSAGESLPSQIIERTVTEANNTITLEDLPENHEGRQFAAVHVYRQEVDAPPEAEYYFLDEAVPGGTFPDNGSEEIDLDRPLETGTLNGNYSYYVTFGRDGEGVESRPSPLTGPINIVDGRIHLSNIPTPPADDDSGWNRIRIYRNLSTDDARFYRVAEFDDWSQPLTFTDNVPDSAIQDPDRLLDFEGPRIRASTLLTDVYRRDGSNYEQVFEEGMLSFSGRKGGRSLSPKQMEITGATTVLDLLNFMREAMGIQLPPGPDVDHPIPPDSSGANPGGSVTGDGQIRLIGNNGVDNALSIGLASMQITNDLGTTNVNLPFSTAQEAKGESAVADFIVYDSLGIGLSVRLTAALESRTSTTTTYRWFADSPDNDDIFGPEIGVGTGLITFDGEGNFVSATNDRVAINRRHVASSSPLEFAIDFGQLSGLSAEASTLAVNRQDGSAPGVLTSFIVGEEGRIRGVFSNGVTRDLGQILLGRFANPAGLEQKGENLFSAGVNSGLPVVGNPQEQGLGSVIGGAVELSNTDIGGNLIDLILASTMYRGNTRVISTSQQMLDELLAIRR